MTALARPTRPAETAPQTAGVHLQPVDEHRPNRTDLRIVSVFTVLLVLTNRIGVPAGETAISVGIPLAYIFSAVMIFRGVLRVDRLRGELYLLAVGATLATTAWIAVSGRDFSMTSYLLLVVVYLPWILSTGGPAGRDVVLAAGRAFVGTMLVLSVVGVLQLLSQLAGVWSFRDYLSDWVPTGWIVPFYNFDNPLGYDNPVRKANAFVLLEPSFLSQYAALAVLVGLVIGVRAWKQAVLLAGVASAVSGTGVLLLAVGGVLVVARAPKLVRPSHLVAGALGVLIVFMTPVADVLLSRRGELSEPGSSGYARFVSPYQEVLRGLAEETQRNVVGAGAGMTERLLASNRYGGGDDVLYGVVPKLLFEYGLVAGGLVLLFIVLAVLDRAPLPVVPVAMLFMVMVLSGALLQPQTAYLVWLLSSIGGGDVVRRVVLRRQKERAAPPEDELAVPA
ncbi:hypothetical protein SAMN06264364_10151 [Quadrisphaera granulorum]|uniref:O-antigen ligase-like membrane protein n=1 Tax=Quadrisphaera granulorum TaxID=317664 RepID=A0A316B0Q1_9ACTN|nr:hypothetical protein [Quadrisphaera granulorum]PWJ56077.1 hypothetical protein BXY45_10151 [Quadrisphaera granulorum]SZE94711.1 hypothetical protein SAMN06264364_10151 [Quadrisphaera granulorum]